MQIFLPLIGRRDHALLPKLWVLNYTTYTKVCVQSTKLEVMLSITAWRTPEIIFVHYVCNSLNNNHQNATEKLPVASIKCHDPLIYILTTILNVADLLIKNTYFSVILFCVYSYKAIWMSISTSLSIVLVTSFTQTIVPDYAASSRVTRFAY